MARLGLKRRRIVMQEVETAVNRAAGQPKLAEDILQGALETRFSGGIWAVLLPLAIEFGMKMLKAWLEGKLNTPKLRAYGADSEDDELDSEDASELATFESPATSEELGQ